MILKREYHRLIYTGSLMLIAASLPLSIFSTSLAQFILLGNWLAEGEFRKKWERLRQQPAVLIFLCIYFMHLVGLIWTSDFSYGMKDLQIKVPLLLIPLVMGSSEIPDQKALRSILFSFTAGVVAASFASILAMLGVVPVEIEDFRNYSLFISHIRFSLMVILAWAVAINFLFIQEQPVLRAERIFYYFSLAWLPVFLIFLRSLSGVVIFSILVFLFALIRISKMKDPVTRFMLIVFLLLLPLLSLAYVGNVAKNYYSIEAIDVETMDSLTVEGNPYESDLASLEAENGHLVWVYICSPELEREWNKVSEIDFNSRDLRGQRLKATLIRYMSSLGLRKDAAGFSQLGPEDIRAVENGFTNVIYLRNFSLYPRIYELIWEIDSYRRDSNPNSHSVIQRVLYLKAGAKIASENLLLGVGTGDVPSAFRQYYEDTNSPLREKWRRRAHNQYLTFIITFGIPGFLLMLYFLVRPAIISGNYRYFLPSVFLFTMALSMLNEDTLETSAGVTPFALFYVLLVIYGNWERKTSV